MSLLARRHFLLQPDNYGDVIYFGSASDPADGGGPTTSPRTIVPPASMVIGDLVVVYMMARDNDNALSISVTGGQTWNALTLYSDAGGDGQTSRVYWCQFNGTWAANPQFAFTGTARPRSAIMHVFRSNSPFFSAWNFGVQTSFGNDSVAPMINPGVTTTVPSTLAIAVWHIVNGSTWSGLSGAGWKQLGGAQYRNLGGSQMSATFAYRYNKIADATGDVSKSASADTFGTQFIITFYQTLTV